MKKFKDLLKGIKIKETWGDSRLLELVVKGVSEDSREVGEDFVFFSRRGTTSSGDDFIEEAVTRGAKWIIRETPVQKSLKGEVFQVRVENIREAMFSLTSEFYERPQDSLTLVGITGTNGKTSVAYFLKQASCFLGLPASYIGTLGYFAGDCSEEEKLPARETTPGIIKTLEVLKLAKEKGSKLVAIEVSSHALSQDRIKGLVFDVCAFTNLSPEHLDYHKNMEEYFNVKKKLFKEYLKPTGKGVISFETEWGKRLFEELKRELKGELIKVNTEGFRACFTSPEVLELNLNGKSYEVKTKVKGRYQAKNLATLAGILFALGFDDSSILKALEGLEPPPGRIECVASFNGGLVFVDYAHTPEALKEALSSVKDFVKPGSGGRVILVFGCGGNRDKTKRIPMGEVAEQLADYTIITSDNPRWEDPIEVIKDIEKGFKSPSKYEVEVDRRRAIERALELLKEGDVLLIAGKGHEEYQEVRGKRIPFSDKKVVKEVCFRK